MTRLIDADALITAVLKKAFDDVFLNGNTDMHRLLIQVIAHQPTIDAEPVRHGKWIYGNDFHWYTASCNKCGYQRRTDIKAEGWNQWKFCPNCGADMRGESDD